MADVKLAMLLGQNIPVSDICTVKQTRLVDLVVPDVYEQYHQALSIVSYNTDDVIELYSAKAEYDALPPAAQQKINAFDLLISVDFFREVLRQALQFFIEETVLFDPELGGFSVFRGKRRASLINSETYKEVRETILKMNFIKVEAAENEHVFANSKAKAIFEKLKKGRKKKLQAGGEMLSIPDLISAVSIYSNSYNLLNIGQLTVYQLYDQFYRLDTKTQVDVCSLKWAAWGTEPFDFSVWYKKNQ